MTRAITQFYLGRAKTWCNICNSKRFFDSYILHAFLKPYSKFGYSIPFQNNAVTENKNMFRNFVCLYTQVARETLVLYELLIRYKMNVARYIASEYTDGSRNDSKFAQGT